MALALSLLACSDEPASSATAPQADWAIGVEALIEPGAQRTLCRYRALPDAPSKIVAGRHRAVAGAHHTLLYSTRLAAGEVDLDRTFDCEDGAHFEAVIGGYYAAGASDEGSWRAPSGVAIDAPGSQVVLLEHHVVNTTGDSIDTKVTVELEMSDDAPSTPAYAFAMLNHSLYVAPQSTATSGMRCPIPAQVAMFALAPHYHGRGERMRASLINGTSVTPLLAGEHSEAESLVAFDPAITAPAGSFIDFECDYTNTSADLVVAGPSTASHEMCLLVGLYYGASGEPLDQAAGYCSGPEAKPYYNGGNVSCSAGVACAVDVSFTVGGPTGDAAVAAEQACYASMCKEASLAAADLGWCIEDACLAECGYGGLCSEPFCPTCVSCIDAKCAAEDAACQLASCE